MGKLNAAARKALPTKDFAGPDRSYPVNDASHARNALARVAQHGSPEEKAKVRAKVKDKFPGIAVKPTKRSQGRFAGGHQAVAEHDGYAR